ncbi:hypothetical protein SAMN03159343_3892 [Klenkia marina]|uniref:Uncharacterized protein n=1 Tax=Klenkia marina TaxID=1960309 RepID=A0A1G4Z089_9ACTN|nr:hypothetical protein SAMN03159343_3892 [Klenkia marina]
MLLLPATAVTSWSAGSTAWQGICVVTAALCLPVLGHRGRLAVQDPLPAVEQCRPSAPLLTVQR